MTVASTKRKIQREISYPAATGSEVPHYNRRHLKDTHKSNGESIREPTVNNNKKNHLKQWATTKHTQQQRQPDMYVVETTT